MDKFCDVSLVT